MNNQYTESDFEDFRNHLTKYVSWKSVAVGLIVSLLTLAALLGLGMAFGGIGIDDNSSVKGASVFTGLWFLFATIISLFIGSYYAARISSYRVPKFGAANGLLVASLFILLFIVQVFSAIGIIGRSAGSIAGRTVSVVGDFASGNKESVSMVANYVEEQFLDLELRSSPQVVASGVASRLLVGNTQGAQKYLAYQANIGNEDAQARVAQLTAEANRMVHEAKQTVASALRVTGWSLFFLTILSAIAAVLGGLYGARKIVTSTRTQNLPQQRMREANT